EYRYRHQLNLNSLPTRRSSDLVDIMEGLKWLKNGTELLWLSERDGWRHAYSIPLDGRAARLITPGDFDVISVTGADPSGQWLYFMASPGNATQRYLYRTRLDGTTAPERVSPAG